MAHPLTTDFVMSLWDEYANDPATGFTVLLGLIREHREKLKLGELSFLFLRLVMHGLKIPREVVSGDAAVRITLCLTRNYDDEAAFHLVDPKLFQEHARLVNKYRHKNHFDWINDVVIDAKEAYRVMDPAVLSGDSLSALDVNAFLAVPYRMRGFLARISDKLRKFPVEEIVDRLADVVEAGLAPHIKKPIFVGSVDTQEIVSVMQPPHTFSMATAARKESALNIPPFPHEKQNYGRLVQRAKDIMGEAAAEIIDNTDISKFAITITDRGIDVYADKNFRFVNTRH